MNYKNWMRKTYLTEKGPKGKLAQRIKADGRFPINGARKFDGWQEVLMDYLRKKNADINTMNAFFETWTEYEACERKRLNMRL